MMIDLIAAVYIIGIVVAYSMMEKWEQPKWQKVVFALFLATACCVVRHSLVA